MVSAEVLEIMKMVIWLVLSISFSIIGIYRMKLAVIAGFIWIVGGITTFLPIEPMLGILTIGIGMIFMLTGAFGFTKGR